MLTTKAVATINIDLIGLSIDIAISDQLSASSQLIDRSHDMLTGFVIKVGCHFFIGPNKTLLSH